MPDDLQFFEKLDTLHGLLDQHNGSSSALSDIEELLQDLDVRREFFNTLEDPSWINELLIAGHFDHAPEAKREVAGIKYPFWPASKYLARMAKSAPDEVAAAFARIETDNASVNGDMLDAALAMPSEVVLALVPAICRVAKEGIRLSYFKNASDLCVRLTKDGKYAAALELAEALFAPSFEDGLETPSHRDMYWYKKGLEEVVPVLAEASANIFLPKLCDWLKASVQAKQHIDPDSGPDYSYSWRPAIEEHEQNHDYDFAGVMVGLVRQGFEEAIQSKQLSLEEALGILDPYTYLIFRRIRLHLINEFADRNPDLARQAILDRELFNDYQYQHEYAMLVGRHLDLLSQQQRDQWFSWIDEGPDRSDIDESEQDRQDSIDYWKFERLHWVRAYLKGQKRDLYEQMLKNRGEPNMADFVVYMGTTRWGDESPMTVEELAGMTFEQAVEAVSSWEPEKSPFPEPNIRGLASTFQQYIATNPGLFSAKAQNLIDRPAIFIRGFIHQMSEAIKADQEIDLPPVLELCHRCVERRVEERTTPVQEGEVLVDKDWQWTREEVSQLVGNVCKARNGDSPRYPIDDFRQSLWSLIQQLCHDHSESSIVHDISEDDPRVHDYLDLGINSPRGRAVVTALEYARWVANHIKKSDGGREVIDGGFDTMPKVKKMLDWLIAPDNRSFEVMSVIGSQIDLVYWIDKHWLSENADRIFQLQGIEQKPPTAQGWAAWNAFLVWVRPHIEFYRLFKSQFAYTVEQAAKVELPEHARVQPMHRLGEHLMILYGRGQLGLDDDEGLLRQFVNNATPEVRRHAFGFVGRSLSNQEAIPQEVLERFEALWDLYWKGPGQKDAAEKPDAHLFGTWFMSGQFPEQWAIDNLEQVVQVTPMPQPDHAITKKLAEIAHVDIAKSVQILDRIVRSDREGWLIGSWSDSAKAILDQAMRAGGETRTQAEELINYLGRLGFSDFGELLRS